LQSLLPSAKGLSFTFMLSLHLLSLCTVQESIVVILSIMCIVPKFSLIDSWFWFQLFLNYLYLVTLLNLKVSYAFIFCYSMKDKLKTICYVFPYDLNRRLTFIVSFSWSFVCVLLHVITCLLSFFYQDYVFPAHVLSSFDPSTPCLHRWSRLCRCMSPQKLFLCYHLPTRGWAGVKLGDADTSQTYL
jgi:hypothetical protein